MYGGEWANQQLVSKGELTRVKKRFQGWFGNEMRRGMEIESQSSRRDDAALKC